jgi:hypothetical protein
MESSKTTEKTSWDIAGEVSRTRKIAFQAAVFLTSFLVLFSRRPDAILNAQFYAEDGARWYADAYHLGWHCLLIPETGYLQTVSRLVGLFSQLFPLAVAPLVMNLCALTVQILPVNFFLSSRFSAVPLDRRLIGCLLYLGIPNSIEVHANTTNIQWHLALLACLVLLARPPESRVWNVFDLCVLLLITVDSPLGAVLVAAAAGVWRKRRDAQSKWHFASLIPGTILQIAVVLLSQAHGREPVQSGATLGRLTGILGGQIFLSSELGARTFAQLFLFGDRRLLFSVEAVAMIAGLVLVVYSFRSAPFELRLFTLFAAGVLILALSRPIAGPDANFPQWEYLQIPGRSSRYYFFSLLAFYASLFWLASTGASKGVRYLAFAFLLLLPIGVYRDWRYPRFADLHFQSYAAAFERSAVGNRVTIPINPVGWEMQIVKH